MSLAYGLFSKKKKKKEKTGDVARVIQILKNVFGLLLTTTIGRIELD